MTEKQIRDELSTIKSELKKNKNSAELLNDAGVGFYLLGELETSRKYLEKAVQLKNSASYVFNLANTYADMGQNAKALDAYLQVLEMNPSHIGALNNLADEYERAGEPEKAHELFHYLTHLQPDRAISHFNLGNFFLRQNQHIEASKCYEKAITKDSEFTDAYYNIAWILFRAKAYSESKLYVQKGLRTDPDHQALQDLQQSLEKEEV